MESSGARGRVEVVLSRLVKGIMITVLSQDISEELEGSDSVHAYTQ